MRNNWSSTTNALCCTRRSPLFASKVGGICTKFLRGAARFVPRCSALPKNHATRRYSRILFKRASRHNDKFSAPRLVRHWRSAARAERLIEVLCFCQFKIPDMLSAGQPFDCVHAYKDIRPVSRSAAPAATRAVAVVKFLEWAAKIVCHQTTQTAARYEVIHLSRPSS